MDKLSHSFANRLSLLGALLLMTFLLPTNTEAQTELITSGGGFENATATFPANGWTKQLPTTSRKWRVGTAAGSNSGVNSAYVGAASNFNGDQNADVMHFYRDITIPAGAYGLQLQFALRETAVDNGNDFLRIYTTDPDHTPALGTVPGAGYTLRYENTSTLYPTFTVLAPIDLSDLENSNGTTVRVVFTFISNGATPNAKLAVDDISVSYTAIASCPGYKVVVAIQTDNHPGQTTWVIEDDGGNALASGGPYPGQQNTLVLDTVCLGSSAADACYRFKVFDSAGNGLNAPGNWALKTLAGRTILADNFPSGSVSPADPQASGDYGSAHSFCLPVGSCKVASTECGIYNNALGNKVFCDHVAGATQYQFEFSDPDAGFVRRIVRTINYVHFGDMVSNPLTPGVHYFCRVRTNQLGPLAEANFGTGCDMGLGVAQVVTCSELISAPANGHSCNETRPFGSNGYIYAVPVQGASQYQFEIYTPDGNYDEVFSSNSYILHLAWNDHPPLVNGTTYNVSVNVTVNGLQTGFCPSTCTITIENNKGGRPDQKIADVQSDTDLNVWPNPNNGDRAFLTMHGLDQGMQTIRIDLFDATGRNALTTTVPVADGELNTVLDLHGINPGSYVLRILAGDQVFNRKLVVEK